MRVPDEAGLRDAKLTLSFAAWKEAEITSATITLPIVEPEPKPKPAAESSKRPEPKVADSKELRLTLRHEGYVSGLAYAPDGRLLATLDYDSHGGEAGIHVWDAATHEKRAMLPLKAKNRLEAFSLQFSADGKLLAVTTREVRMSPDGHRYEAWLAWEVKVFDVEARKERSTFRTDQAGAASISAFDGQSLLLSVYDGEPWSKSGRRSRRLVRLDAISGKMTTIYESNDREAGLYVVSPDRKTAVIGLSPSSKTINTEMQLLDLETRQTRPLAQALGSVISAATFSPDGKTCVVSLHREVTFWDPASGKKRTELTERYATFRKRPENERLRRLSSLRYSPDGKLLALVFEVFDLPSRRDIPEIVLWEVDTGKVLTVLRGHTQTMFNLAFSLDGRTLASGGFDKMVKLWNVPAGE